MWEDAYQQLSSYEKGEFRRLGNYILSHSYLVKERYYPDKGMSMPDENYRMAYRLFPILRDYFEYIGWKLEKDDVYGVISIHSEFDNNRLRIDKFTTLFLYTLRLIYEEEREKINNYRNVRTETQAVVEKMYSFGLLPGGKTTIKERIEAQRTLAHHNIIQKIEGKWEPDGNHLIVFPSILHIVSVQGINDMLQELEDMRVQPVQEEGTDEEAADE
ncbi:MAG: DUF4194 domain-containing protein [Oscillospiraceae bacterium]|jgi:hypothetical protein